MSVSAHTRQVAVFGIVALMGTAVPAQAQQKETPPPVGAPKAFRLPAKASFTLPNGIPVVLVPFGMVPKAQVRVVLRSGNADEGPNEIWLADLAGDLMREGTTRRPAADVAREFASMGGSLDLSVGADQTTIATDVLSERAADAVRLVAEVVRHPLLPPSELPRLVADRVRQLSIEKSQPQPQARERFMRMLYGEHPYGRVYPTEAMLRAYGIEQVRRFYADHFGAARARIYVAGVFDAGAVERAVREAFGDWERGSAPGALPPAQPVERRQLALMDRPGAPQSTVFLGLTVPDPTRPEWIPLQVTDALLGGSFGSRITTNIREQKGFTYSPYSMVTAHPGTAAWLEVADVTTNVTGAALKEIFGEIERLQREAPSAEELRGIQNNLAGVFTLQNASRGGVIGRLSFVDLYGLGDDYLTQYIPRLLAVTPADVQRVTQTYLKPERMTLVVVGDRKTVEAQLAPYQATQPVVP